MNNIVDNAETREYFAQLRAKAKSIADASEVPISSGLSMALAVAARDREAKEKEQASLMVWERDGWVPCTKSGKQKSPNVIRNELQRYIDQCKATGTSTQTEIVSRMGVNNNSFRRFMNPKTYKNQWSATENGTYWAAARLLEQSKYDKEQSKKAGKKRKATDEATTTNGATEVGMKQPQQPAKKTKAEAKTEILNLVERITAIEGVSHEDGVYDSCPQVVTKIKAFLQRDGVTKALLLSALGGINSNSLNRFLAGKKQDQCANVAYRNAYVFFEKMRVLEKKAKTKARLKNEEQQPGGFSLVKERAQWYVVPVQSYRMGMF
jgi:hypothetical protein